MSPKRKRQIYNLFGIILSASFIYLCFHFIDRQGLKQAFTIARPWLLTWVIALNFLVMGLRTELWRNLLKPLQRLPFWNLFDLLHVGYMANNLLPLKAGEFFRASFVAKKYKIPYAQALTTVGLERYFSGFSLFLLFVGVAYFLNMPLWIKSGAYVMIGILIAVQIILIILWKKKPDHRNWETRHPIIYRTMETLSHIGEGSQPLKSGRSFALLIFLALLTWGGQWIMLKVIEAAYPLQISWVATLFVLIAVNLAIALPSAPGNLGTFELASVLAYGFVGVDRTTGLVIGIFFHFLQAIPITLVGLIYYYRWGLHFKDMERTADELM